MAVVPTVGVDFDGTLCDEAYPKIGAPKAGAKEALTMLKALGYRIVIWTCRTCHYHYDVFGGDPNLPTMEREKVIEMQNWLKGNDIPYDEIDDGSRGKLHADYYIDDKGIRFENNWDAIVFAIHQKQIADKQLKAQQQQAAMQQAAAQGGAIARR